MTSRRRSAAFLSVLAGASLVVAMSSNAGATDEPSNEAATPTTDPSDTTDETTTGDTGETTETTTEDTGGTTPGSAAEGTGAEIGGSACGEPHGPYDEPAEAPAGEVRVAWNDPLLSFNSSSSRGNATANNNPLYLMNLGGFSYYDGDLVLVNNDQFGTCSLDSLDPLTVTYTINEGVTWSDGTPVDAADLVLQWAATGTHFNSADSVVTGNGLTVAADPDGNPIVIGPDGAELPSPVDEATTAAYTAAFDPEGATGAELLEGFTYKESTGIAFDGASESLELVTQFPEISEDGRSVTITWDSFYVDYETGGLGVGVPAHVVGQNALQVEDPMEAKEALLAALEAAYVQPTPASESTATTTAGTTAGTETTTAGTTAGSDAPAGDPEATADVAAIANFWNTGFDATSLPGDPGIYVGYGPYNLTGYDELTQMTFEVREDYTWGPKPQVQTIVYSIIGDPVAAVQAMENEEVDIIQPQATADILTQLQGLADRGIEVLGGDGATYEHVDLVYGNGGPFDPATYGGDEETARAVRQAFLLTVPRQEIVDRLIVPLNPDAVVRDSLNEVPGSPNYDETVANNGSDAYAEQDIEGAIALLAEAGVDTSTPIDVRFLFAANNPRRAAEYELIRDAAAQAGFNVIDGNSPTWGQDRENPSLYDASLFGWQSTAIAVAASEAQYVTGGLNNPVGFSNPEIDALYEELKSTTDPARQVEINIEVETLLLEDGFSIPIFQHPAITGFNSTYVSGVDNIALAPTVFYNFWEWQAAS